MEEEKQPQIRDLRNGDWFWANKLVLDHPYLKATTKLVYCALSYFANNETQKSFPSIETIIKLTGLTRPTIISAIKQLKAYYFIKVKTKQGKVSEYTLLQLTDSKPVKNFNQLKRDLDQLKRNTTPVKNRHSNNTHLTILNNNNGGFKKLKDGRVIPIGDPPPGTGEKPNPKNLKKLDILKVPLIKKMQFPA